MESPGEFLKRERDLRGVELRQIAEASRVPLDQLEALENDDYDGLPHLVYVRGYIKSYCKCLGLDEADAVLRYEIYAKEHLGTEDDGWGGEVVRAERDVVFSPATVTVMLVVAGFLAIIIFFAYSTGGPGTEKVVTVSPEVAAAVSTNLSPNLSTDASTDGASEKRSDATEAPETPETVEASPVEPGEKATTTAAAGRKHTLSVRAVENTWMRVSIDDGDPFETLLERGDSALWHGDEVFFYLSAMAPEYS